MFSPLRNKITKSCLFPFIRRGTKYIKKLIEHTMTNDINSLKKDLNLQVEYFLFEVEKTCIFQNS